MMPMPKFLWSNNQAADEQIQHMSSLYMPEYLKEMIENYDEYDEWKTWINFVKTTQERPQLSRAAQIPIGRSEYPAFCKFTFKKQKISSNRLSYKINCM